MSTGFKSETADAILNYLRGVAPTPPPGLFVKLHLGDPGAAGTANPSAVTTRSQGTFSASAADSGARKIALTGTKPSWTMTATETLTHISVWDDVDHGEGTVRFTGQLATPKNVVASDIFTLDTLNVIIPSSAIMA